MKGSRAVPIKLPDPTSHPKGKICTILEPHRYWTSLNWHDAKTCVQLAHGFRPKVDHFDDDYAKYGLPDFDNELEYIYKLDKNGDWQVSNVRTPAKMR